MVGESMSALRLGSQGRRGPPRRPSPAARADATGDGPRTPTRTGPRARRSPCSGCRRRGRHTPVGHPPAVPAVVEGDQQREGRRQDQRHEDAVAPRLGRVEDHERAQRRQRRRQQARAPPHRADTHRVHQRDRRHPGHQRRQPDRLRTQAGPGRQPRQHEAQRRRDLRGRRDRLHHSPQPMRRHHPIRRQLIAEQILPRHPHPQHPTHHHQHHQRHGHRNLSEAPPTPSSARLVAVRS